MCLLVHALAAYLAQMLPLLAGELVQETAALALASQDCLAPQNGLESGTCVHSPESGVYACQKLWLLLRCPQGCNAGCGHLRLGWQASGNQLGLVFGLAVRQQPVT